MLEGLYTTDVVTMRPDQSITEAAILMRDRNIGDVVVIEGSKTNDQRHSNVPVGILTDRDIVVGCLANRPKHLDDIKIADVMTRNPQVVKEDAGIFDAVRIMRDAGVGRLLVVDDKRSLVGIITAQKIFNLLSEELHDLATTAHRKNAGAAAQPRTRHEEISPAHH